MTDQFPTQLVEPPEPTRPIELQPPAQQHPYPSQTVYYAPAQPTNGLAIASMVLGIVWIYWIGSILAVIFGHVALNQIDRSGQGGRGMAIAGLVLGYIGVGILAIVIIVAVIGAAAAGY